MGKFTDPNFRCASKGCGHFVADHTTTDPKTGEVDVDSGNRYGCHANGAACTCAEYIDGGQEEELTEGQAGAIRVAKAAETLAAKKAAAAGGV